MNISNPLNNFFQVEIRNEEEGGVSPATLASAYDSFWQAPDDVMADWCGLDEAKYHGDEIEAELKRLIAAHGEEYELDDLVE